jgi:hypothetical protein
MSRKRILGIAAFAASFIALAAAILLLTTAGRGSAEFDLPDTPAHAASPDAVPGAEDDPARVLVTPDTVQDVIATLARPASYSRDIMVESFWEGGFAVFNLSAAVSRGAVALRSAAGGVAKTVVVAGDRLYIWYAGDDAPYTAELTDGGALALADEYQMLMTYEDVLALDKSAITGAGFALREGEACVWAEYVSGAFGYRTTCYVSVALGLLVGATVEDGETVIYRMTAGACDLAEPDPALFRLPGGASALAAPAGEF